MTNMKINSMADYLHHNFFCSCGKNHKTDLEYVEISEDAIKKIPEFIEKKSYKKIFMVADKNTYVAAGKQVEEEFKLANIKVNKIVLDEEEVVPNEESIMKIQLSMEDNYDLIIGVGTGTINDMCKYISYKLKIDYIIVATAPSMDGFASVGAALIINNLKTTYDTHVPTAIIADINVLSKAPMNMITAGLGDILGKYTCLCDWKIANIINGEYYCEEIVKMVKKSIKKVVQSADKVMSRSKEAINNITEALIGTGIAMSFVGNSRPASGSEHHISHYWEMKFLFEGRKPVLHGTKVGIGTVAVIKLYEMLLKEKIDFEKAIEVVESYDQKIWEEKMRESYGCAANGVIQLESKTKKNSKVIHGKRIKKIEEHWSEITRVIEESLPSVKVIEDTLISLNAPINPNQVGVHYEMIKESILVAKEVRNRYSLLQLLWDLGIADKMATKIADYFEYEQTSYIELNNKYIKEKINNIKCFILDMDGTIYLGKDLFDFTPEFLKTVKKTNREYYFFTNNSSKSQESYINKLKNMNIIIEPKQMMISSHVIIKHLKENYKGKTVYVVGTKSLLDEFRKSNINFEDENPDIVIIGFDTSLTYEKLEKACNFIRNGKIYFGINPDLNCPMERNTLIPDCGSMARLIESSTNRLPEFFGKPSHYTLEYIIEKTGYKENEIAIVGDRLYTDIAVTKDSDVLSILVLSGETQKSDIGKSSIQPDIVVNSLADITKVLQS
ncbi:iron-containing alcohol dehydrogenase [Clostridium brassicae]|uniref:iron-containing alcohol dehydrogenase n=1 Tax=Clostridium brassicae TaxID=2999072 RepID=UPI002DD6A07B|nr:iron-containing alcohol dehydrogenase [Clostridium brassicae]